MFGANGSNRSTGSGGDSGAETPQGSGGRGLVFPPLNIAETGIDIDMDNLFRRRAGVCIAANGIAGLSTLAPELQPCLCHRSALAPFAPCLRMFT